MKRENLKRQLLEHINNNEDWLKKVELYVLGDEWGYSPESVARCCRTLAEEGAIQVSYYDGKWSKGLAKYARLSVVEKAPQLQEIIKPDGTRVMVMQ